MLSKKISDFIFVGAILIIFITLFIARILILGQYDSRIDRAEQDSSNLQNQIAEISELVEDNKNDQLPSMVEMYQQVPSEINGGQLIDYINGMLEISGIKKTDTLSRQVILHLDPVSFPDESEFSEVSEELTPYRLQINFQINDTDSLINFIENMEDSKQLFVIQNLSYETPEDSGDPISVTIHYIAFYQSTETE